MKLQGADKNAAAAVLRTKALGIGEKHDEPGGRRLALDLLEENNLVRHLFIEILARQQEFVDRSADRISKKDLLENIMSPLIAAFGGQEDCKIRLEDVVSKALRKGVKVFCADVNRGTSVERLTERNNAIAKKVVDVADTNFIGCLLLFGSDHFDGGVPPNPLIQTLCMHKILQERMDWVRF